MSNPENTVRSLYNSWIKAWNDRDAVKMGEFFSENVAMVGFDGSQMMGREDAVTQLTQIFKDFPTGEFFGVIDEVRLLHPQTALLRAVASIIPRGYKDINPNVNAIQSLVANNIDGVWKIELFQNTPAAFHGRPELQEQLTTRLRNALKANSAH